MHRGMHLFAYLDVQRGMQFCELVNSFVFSVDSDVVANKFANHFCAAYKANNAHNAELLYKHYMEMRANYCGFPISDEQVIDTEVISNVISGLHRGSCCWVN